MWFSFLYFNDEIFIANVHKYVKTECSGKSNGSSIIFYHWVKGLRETIVREVNTDPVLILKYPLEHLEKGLIISILEKEN